MPDRAVVGTAIAAIGDGDRIVLAADGLKLELPRRRKFRGCKIHQTAEVLYAAAGLTGVDGLGFRATDLVERTLVGASFREQVASFERDARVPARRLWEYVRDHPAIHESLRPGDPILSLVFAGLDEGQPLGFGKEYGWDENRKFEECPLRRVPKRGWVFFGEHKAMDAAGQRALETGQAGERDAVIWARELIEIAINDCPEKVGAPVCVAALSCNGVVRECRCSSWQRALAWLCTTKRNFVGD